MKSLLFALMLTLPISLWASSEPQKSINKNYIKWVEQMKSATRGPFKDVKWFCNDGSVLPPKAYACKNHGGGQQRGNYTKHAQTLRDNGYYIANFLGGLDAKKAIKDVDFNNRYNQLYPRQLSLFNWMSRFFYFSSLEP